MCRRSEHWDGMAAAPGSVSPLRVLMSEPVDVGDEDGVIRLAVPLTAERYCSKLCVADLHALWVEVRVSARPGW